MSASRRIVLPTNAVTAVPIAGKAVTGSETSEVRSPFDDSVLGHVPLLGAAEVERAVAAAKNALHDQPLPVWKRAEILDRASVLLRERQEEFAQLIAHEAAKPIKTARVEADRAAGTFAFAAVEARKLAGEVIPIDAAPGADGKIAYTMRVPIGVIGAISPFNFPLNLVAHKLAPAIAAGAPTVLKPAGQTPFSAIALAWLLVEECG
ncbi:MAG TPA: aldehyde dehydrogenase family protein, partial [Actinomycetes bacterium]|nr:aldehyde dehydrogenase family protein [Actinomycetes bacterium]